MSGEVQPPQPPRWLARKLLSREDADRLLEALDDEYLAYQRRDRTAFGAWFWYWRQVVRSIPAMRSRGGGSLRLDLVHLRRGLRRSPLSAVAAVLTLALTLGPGTAILAVVDQVLLRPPPFEDPGAVVTVGEIPVEDVEVSPRRVGLATFTDWQVRAEPLAKLEAFDPTNLTLTGLGDAVRVEANNVTPGFLGLLGVTPVLGRNLEASDAGRPVVIISDDFWRARLGGDPAVLGRRVVLGGLSHDVVGVLPPGFLFALGPAELWRPLAPAGDGPVHVVARLQGAISARELETRLDPVSLSGIDPAHARATPIVDAITGDSPRTLTLLAGAAAMALALAFMNLAVLLIVRSIDRRRELAIRRALGASPWDPARHLVLEATVLVGIGTLGGVVLASWLTPVIGRHALELGGLTRGGLTVSWRAVGVAAALGAACAIFCGLGAALRRPASGAGELVRGGGTSVPGDARLRRVFVAAEVAVAFVLLVSMALLGRSLVDLLATDAGFDPRGVLKLQVSLPPSEYPSRERAAAFYTALTGAVGERLAPGSVALVSEVPLTGDGGRSLVGPGPEDMVDEAVVRATGPGYFEVLSIPVVAGRPFLGDDDPGAPPRAVVTRSLALRLFEVEDAVGRELWLPGNPRPLEIVGVAGDVPHRALGERPLPTVYLSALQQPSASSILVVRSSRPRGEVAEAVRAEVRGLDPDVPVYDVRAMEDVVAASPGVPTRRVLTAVLGAFSILAVVLSVVGLFGVAAHDAARGRRELALRLALGASPSRVVSVCLRKDVVTVAAGLLVGSAMSLLAVSALGAVVLDAGPASLMAVSALSGVLLLAVAGLAVVPVAIRAAAVDPGVILGSE